MTNSIGLRFYKIIVSKKGDNEALFFGRPPCPCLPLKFFSEQLDEYGNVAVVDEAERSWFINTRPHAEKNKLHGLVHYGNYGFESNIVDLKSRTTQYSRKVTDIEEIPLYFQFWLSSDENFGLAAFQSFGTRSCITMIQQSLSNAFKNKYPDYVLRFQKLMPEELNKAAYENSPVKRIRLIRKTAPSDVADTHLFGLKKEEIEYEVSLVGKRSKYFDRLAKIRDRGRKDAAQPLLVLDGIEFDDAVAEIEMGGKIRTVGILGISKDAGAIDITNHIKKGTDGHPDFGSIVVESNSLMSDFYRSLI